MINFFRSFLASVELSFGKFNKQFVMKFDCENIYI